MTDKQVQFESKFSYGLLPIHFFVCFGAGYVGQDFSKSQEIASRLIGLFFLGFSAILLIELLKVKLIKTTRESLILTYPLLFKTLTIPWGNLTNADKKITTTKIDALDTSYSIGRSVTLYTNQSKYSFTSFYYKNFDKFLLQLNKRMNASIKDRMREDFNMEQKKFLTSEKEVSRLIKYFVMIALAVMVLIWILI